MKKALLSGIATGLFLVSAAGSTQAATINWTDWTAATAGVSGTATGTIAGGINVSYSGDVTFYQLGTGINYWTEGSPAPYTGSSTVDNAPTASEMIALSQSGITNTIRFSAAVLNPLMAIVSQGQTGLPVTYDFDQSFTVLSEGRGYWGDGWYNTAPGDLLTGYEFHGVIQFSGLVSSISWTAAPNEYWHGITVGVAESEPVPEPATLLLFGTGLAGLAGRRLRKRRAA